MQKLTVILAICIMFSPPVTLLAQQQEPSLPEMMNTLVQVADSWPAKLSSETQRTEVLQLWHRVEGGVLDALEKKSAPEAGIELILGDLYRMGHNLDIEGSGDKAVSHLQRAIDLAPTNPTPYLLLGRHKTFSGDFAGGELSLLRAALLIPADSEVDVTFLLANNYYYQQRFELVVHLADRFPKDHPGSGVINFLREHAVQALETGKAPKIIQIDLNKPNSEPH